MKKITSLFVLLFALTTMAFGQSTDMNPFSQPTSDYKTFTPLTTDAPGALLRNLNIDSLTPGAVGGYGIVWTGSYFIVGSFNANKFFRFNLDWSRRDSFSVTGNNGLFRDMAFAKGLLWGVNTTNQIFGVDTGTFATVKTITCPSAATLRALCWDPIRNGFWVGTTSFTGPVVCVDTNGVNIPGATMSGLVGGYYGIGYDTDPAGPWLWVSSDATPANATQTKLMKYNATTLAKVDSLYVTVPLQTPVLPSTTLASGGSEVYSNLYPGKRVALVVTQSGPDRAIVVELSDLPAPPVADSVLVITNDSTLATSLAIRKADKDTLKKYLPMLTSKIRYITKDTNSTLPSLTSYGTIIVQETAFDAILARGLSNPQRTAIKTWLATGTPTAKKSLLLIGGDISYNYDRAANPFTDTSFSRTIGGFQYISDNAAAAGFNSVINIGGGFSDSLLTGAGNYYPDGARPVSGGIAWDRYLNRTATDSAAGIYKVSSNFVCATIFQDPRYFVGSGGAGASDIGFKRVLKSALAFLKSNSGVITTVTDPSLLADKYSLSQNYPNPFNPTTKITFAIPTTGFVTLKVYNMVGKEVMTLVNQSMNVGNYTVDFNGAGLSSGAYFYRLEAGNFVETKKMLLVK